MISFAPNPACQILVSEVKQPETPNTKKKKARRRVEYLATPMKKVKIEGHTVIVEANSISAALIYDTQMFGKDKDASMLQLRASHSVYIFNRQSQEWSSDRGLVCGFGVGSFKIATDDGRMPQKSLPSSRSAPRTTSWSSMASSWMWGMWSKTNG